MPAKRSQEWKPKGVQKSDMGDYAWISHAGLVYSEEVMLAGAGNAS